jgi:hypothetical protein
MSYDRGRTEKVINLANQSVVFQMWPKVNEAALHTRLLHGIHCHIEGPASNQGAMEQYQPLDWNDLLHPLRNNTNWIDCTTSIGRVIHYDSRYV